MSQTKPRTSKSFLTDDQLFIHVHGNYPAHRATILHRDIYGMGPDTVIPEHQKDLMKVKWMNYGGRSTWWMGKGSMVSWRGKDMDAFLRDWRPISRKRFLAFQDELRAVDYQELNKEITWRECYDAKLQLKRDLAAELLADDSLTEEA